MSNKPKESLLSELSITDRTSCERAIRNGWIAGLVSAGLTTMFAVVGLFYQPPVASKAGVYFDPWLMVDVGFVLILALFVSRKSRIAATLLLVHFIFGKIVQWSELGEPTGLPLALVFIAYYFVAMRATYLWHGRYRDQSPATIG